MHRDGGRPRPPCRGVEPRPLTPPESREKRAARRGARGGRGRPPPRHGFTQSRGHYVVFSSRIFRRPGASAVVAATTMSVIVPPKVTLGTTPSMRRAPAHSNAPISLA